MEKLISLIAATLLIVGGPSYAIAGGNEGAAQRICSKAAKNINLLADFTRTDCTPAKEADSFSLIFVSLDPVFANAQSKKAYLAVLVGAVGAELNAAPKAKIINVNFMDKELGRQRTYFTISAKEAARLQREIRSDRLDVEGFYSGILASGKVRPVSK